MTEQIINIDRMEQAVALFGTFDENIKLIQNEYMVSVVCRGSELKVTGEIENVAKAAKVIDSLLALINRGEALSDQNVRYCMSLVNEGNEQRIEQLAGDCICITSKGRPVKPKTLGQKKYCNAIKKNTITLGIGPADTIVFEDTPDAIVTASAAGFLTCALEVPGSAHQDFESLRNVADAALVSWDVVYS